MASTYSPALRLELMATGDQSGTWGDTTNTNLGTLLEQAITGFLSVAEGDTTLTLTELDGATDQSRNAVIDLTGAMTGAQNVVVPTSEKVYLIKNSTSGGFAVTVKTVAGTGIAVPPGTARWLYCDGTNVVDGMSGPWSPSSNDAQALGFSGTAWADLFLASGGVVNWNAGDVTITHSANTLAFAGASSGYTFDAVIAGTTATLTGSTAGFVALQAISTEAAAAAGPIIDLYRNSGTPAANDILGQLLFTGEDSAGNTQEYASIEAVIADATSTSEDGVLDAYVPIAGARTRVLSLGPNMSVPTNTNNVTTAPGIAFLGDANTGIGSSGADALDFVNGGVNTARIASTGARSTVIPSGSTLYPAFDCRAWVNFDGTGTPAIRGSGNVSSITDNGTGNYTVNFTTAMPDANYAANISVSRSADNANVPVRQFVTYATGSLRFITGDTGSAVDMDYVNVSIYR